MGMHSEPSRVMFIYWGRRGISRFVLDVARAALASENMSASISVSRQNESFTAFGELGDAVVSVDTFTTNIGALFQAWRIPIIRRQLLRHMASHQPEVIIDLMPHVWSSFVAPALKTAGARYVAVIHDSTPHPGDYRSGSIMWLTKRTLRQADTILTLSSSVAGLIRAGGLVPHDMIFPIPLPEFDFGGRLVPNPPQPSEPWRLLFFGRIMPYKGLSLFLDMVDELRAQSIPVEVGVFGEGNLDACASRLSDMGAEVTNRWLTEVEIGNLLPRFHAIVLSHIEASQSGVAAAAFAAGLPVIATPVGGLVEQVEDEVTGVMAARADAVALAEAAKRLLSDPSLYHLICRNLVSLKGKRSVAHFVEQCVSYALHARPAGDTAQVGRPTSDA